MSDAGPARSFGAAAGPEAASAGGWVFALLSCLADLPRDAGRIGGKGAFVKAAGLAVGTSTTREDSSSLEGGVRAPGAPGPATPKAFGSAPMDPSGCLGGGAANSGDPSPATPGEGDDRIGAASGDGELVGRGASAGA